MRIRPVQDEDCRLLWEWVNDPAVRASAFQSEPVSWEEHQRWFKAKRADPSCIHYVVTDERGAPIGQVRFDLQSNRTAETDVSVAREHRARGMGSEVLRLACNALADLGNAEWIIAKIKSENAASQKAFAKAGFVFQGREVVQGREMVCMRTEVKRG